MKFEIDTNRITVKEVAGILFATLTKDERQAVDSNSYYVKQLFLSIESDLTGENKNEI